MTLPASGTISGGDVNVEIGQARTYSSSLSFLNSLILPALQPSPPHLGAFYGLTYFQNNAQGNCNNGNCTSNCNCGNIQCTNCYISGTVNCTNCDAQQWLQNNCNCACTYNCNTGIVSYNCNCNCNCSKIICAKLHEFGMMDENIWAADQRYGRWLRKNDKSVYRGYVRWARIVTAWMDGKGPDFMVWIKDKDERQKAQQAAMISMANKIGQPWSQHMAYLMGAVEHDNLMGHILMSIGRPICKVVDMLPRVSKSQRKHGLPTVYTIWFFLFFSYYTASTIVNVKQKLNVFKGKLNVGYN